MTLTMTIPDAPTITAIATLIGVVFTGIVAIMNTVLSRRSHTQLREQVGDVKEDTKQTVTNTNGQLSMAHAEVRALTEQNRLLQEQVAKMTPRPSRATDPMPLVPGTTVEPDPAGAIARKLTDRP